MSVALIDGGQMIRVSVHILVQNKEVCETGSEDERKKVSSLKRTVFLLFRTRAKFRMRANEPAPRQAD